MKKTKKILAALMAAVMTASSSAVMLTNADDTAPDTSISMPSNQSTQLDALRNMLDKYITENDLDAWLLDKESTPDGIIIVCYNRKKDNIPLDIIAQVEGKGFDPQLVSFCQEDHEKNGLIEDIETIKTQLSWYILGYNINARIVPESQLPDDADKNIIYVEYLAEKTDIPDKLTAYMNERKIDTKLVKIGVSGSLSNIVVSNKEYTFDEFRKLSEDEVKALFTEKCIPESELWTAERYRHEVEDLRANLSVLFQGNPYEKADYEFVTNSEVYWDDEKLKEELELPEELFDIQQHNWATFTVASGDKCTNIRIKAKAQTKEEQYELMAAAFNYIHLDTYYVHMFIEYPGGQTKGALKGDANCDGQVDMADIVLIMQALANPNKYGENGTASVHLTAQGKKNADMDGNGLTVGDAQKLQRQLLGLSDTVEVKYDKSVGWHVGDLAESYWDICRGNGYAAVITNTDELKTYLAKVLNEKPANEYLEKYTDSFFKDNVLFLDSIYQSGGMEAAYKIENENFSDDEISISVVYAFSKDRPLESVVSLCIAQVAVQKDSYNGQTVSWNVDHEPWKTTEETPSVRLDNTVNVKTAEGKSTDEKFAAAEMKLGIDLLKKSFAPTEEGEENLLISPVSISTALSMTANGADGKTREEMEKLLGNGLTLEQLNEYMTYYISKLPDNEKEKVYLADSIWFKDTPSFKVYDEFLETNKKYYNAELYKAPFTETTENDINSWVNNNTKGMIPSLLKKGDLTPKDNQEILMMLINTLYFDAEWEDPYYFSYDGVFTDMNGQEHPIKKLNSKESEYFDLGDADAFKKPYAGGEYSFVGILPRENDIIKYVNSLDGEKLLNGLKQCEDPESVDLYTMIPKFEYSYNKTLNDVLSELGMPTAFDSKEADFSKINDLSVEGAQNLFISKVAHKTKIEVTEKGTRAAAVTSVEMEAGCAMPQPKKEVYIYLDRPFVYMIVDKNNVPLFIGAATQLEEK